MIWTIIGILLILYMFIDVHHFLRVYLAIIVGKYFRKRLNAFESSEVYGICLPSDADFMLSHMNNSRFLREYDFARFDFGIRNGTLEEVFKQGGSSPVSALTIRYRLPLMLFSVYKVVTTLLWWDEKSVYLDQRLVTISDNIVRTVGFTKLGIAKVNFEKIMAEKYPGIVKPEISEELKTWIEFNELSSQKMKSEGKSKTK